MYFPGQKNISLKLILNKHRHAFYIPFHFEKMDKYEQTYISMGLGYRYYPSRNESKIKLYFQNEFSIFKGYGIHYEYPFGTIKKNVSILGVVNYLGIGVEYFFKRSTLAFDLNIGYGTQTSKNEYNHIIRSGNNFFEFLPLIHYTYQLSRLDK
jgi:hypothetical protein